MKNKVLAAIIGVGFVGCVVLSHKYDKINPRVIDSKKLTWSKVLKDVGTNQPTYKEYVDLGWDYPYFNTNPGASNRILFNLKFATNYNTPSNFWWTYVTVTGTTCRIYITNYPQGFFTITATDIVTKAESEWSHK